MASPQSRNGEQEGEPDLQERVERLERALAELRADVERLRSAAGEEARTSRETSGEEPSEAAEATPAEGEAGDGEEAPPEEQNSSREPEGEESPESVSPAPSIPERAAEGAAARRASSTTSGASSQSSSEADRMLGHLVSWAGLSSEDWLNYVGIGLLLFGLAFLFKYSVEQGWLVPEVRVGFGVALGSALLVAGLRIYNTRRRLRQVLLGGSSATFYATVFAAYELYGLVSYPVAFASMVVVTVATIGLAVQQDESSLAIIGTIGGLGTPFLLYSQAGSVGGLAVYTCTVLVGACAIFLVQGWRSLLYTTVAGGWIVFLVAAYRAGMLGSRPPDAWALQVGIGVAWGLLAGTPVLRVFFRRIHPDRWPGAPRPSWIDRLVGRDRPAYGLVPTSPFLALGASHFLWNATADVWAAVAGVGAVVYAGAHAGLRRASLSRYAPVHGLVAAVLAAYGLSMILEGSALFVAWGVEVLLLHGVARRLDAEELRVAGHALFVVLSLGLVGRLASITPDAARILRPAVLSELVVLGLVAGASVFVRRRWLRWTYRGAVLAGWLGWWAGELAPLPNGNAYLLVVWAVTATGLAATLPRLEGRRPVEGAVHLLFAVLAALFAAQFRWVDTADLPLVSVSALSALFVLGLALGASRFVRPSNVRLLYRGAVLAGWLAWWGRELVPVAYGQAYVSAVWGGTAAALLVGGAWTGRRSAQIGGLATLGLFVGKLFLVDLASLPALWRITLFLGFGAAFLAISYLLPGLMGGASERTRAEDEEAPASEISGA